jgi:predicted O-methyltransferase YrrM
MEVVYHVLDDEAYARGFATLFGLLEPGGVLVFSENFLHGEELRAPHQRSRRLGQIEHVVRAAALYWPELIAVGHMREGPSSELMICRRP